MEDYNSKIEKLFDEYCAYLVKNNIKIVMPTFYPQRGEILVALKERGVDCCILGGKEGVQLFEGIEQHGLEKDTTGMAETDEEQDSLVSKLPERFRTPGTKLVVHGYEQYPWGAKIQTQFPNVEIISHTGQNTYRFFEEKQNLEAILKEAGLGQHFIPSKVYKVDDIKTNGNYQIIYDELKNTSNGKIVIQICGEGHQEAGGGKSTYIVESLENFTSAIQEIGTGQVKIARFIEGAESNLSFFCSTSELTPIGRVKRHDIDPKTAGFYGGTATIAQLLEDSDISDESLYTIVGKATAKCVSCDLLTSSTGNGVGNDVGYIFEDTIRAQIQNIGEKIGRLMAKCGKSGLAGCDLIITTNGDIYINEINDRQQGPTDQMSQDAEANGILSIAKLSFLTAHCPFVDEFKDMIPSIQAQADKISDAYLKNTGNFYIKLNSTHSTDLETPYIELNPNYEDKPGAQPEPDFKFRFAHTLNKGFYRIHRDNDHSPWIMEVVPVELENGLPSIDITKNEIFVKLDGKTQEGDPITTGRQMLRIEGKAVEGSAPFLIQDGKTILNPGWELILESIYNTVVKSIEGSDHEMGDCYQEFNPLLQKRLFAERQALFTQALEEKQRANLERELMGQNDTNTLVR